MRAGRDGETACESWRRRPHACPSPPPPANYLTHGAVVSRDEERAGMKAATAFHTRLSEADRDVLRDPGPIGKALRDELVPLARVAVVEPGYITKRFLYVRARALG